MWVPYAFWPTFVASIISIFLVVYVLKADIRKAGNMAAFLMFLSILIWSIGELIERIAGPPKNDGYLAYFGARLLFFGIAILSAALIHFAIDYPYKIKISKSLRKIIIYTAYGFSVMGVILDILDNFLGKLVIASESPYPALGQTIWGLDPGLVYKIYIAWLFLSGLILLTALLLKLRNVKMKIVSMQIWFTFTGLIIAYILVTLTGLVPVIIGIQMYPLTTVSFSIFGLFTIYTIYRYRLFIAVPASEEIELHEEMPKSGIYKLPKDEAYQKFANLARSGYKALGFISQNIEEFKAKYGLEATPIFEISGNPGRDRLNPVIDEQREMIPFIISSFMEEVENPVILADLTAKHLNEELRRTLMAEIEDTVNGRGVLIVAD